VNRIHIVLCSSRWWSRTVQSELLPWGLQGVELGANVLEVGPGFGATTKVLSEPKVKLGSRSLRFRARKAA
jgi:hypothetical protein